MKTIILITLLLAITCVYTSKRRTQSLHQPKDYTFDRVTAAFSVKTDCTKLRAITTPARRLQALKVAPLQTYFAGLNKSIWNQTTFNISSTTEVRARVTQVTSIVSKVTANCSNAQTMGDLAWLCAAEAGKDSQWLCAAFVNGVAHGQGAANVYTTYLISDANHKVSAIDISTHSANGGNWLVDLPSTSKQRTLAETQWAAEQERQRKAEEERKRKEEEERKRKEEEERKRKEEEERKRKEEEERKNRAWYFERSSHAADNVNCAEFAKNFPANSAVKTTRRAQAIVPKGPNQALKTCFAAHTENWSTKTYQFNEATWNGLYNWSVSWNGCAAETKKAALRRRVQAIVPKEPTYPKVSFVAFAKACNAANGSVVKNTEDRKWACAALTNCAAKVTTSNFQDSHYPYVRFQWSKDYKPAVTPAKGDNMSDVVTVVNPSPAPKPAAKVYLFERTTSATNNVDCKAYGTNFPAGAQPNNSTKKSVRRMQALVPQKPNAALTSCFQAHTANWSTSSYKFDETTYTALWRWGCTWNGCAAETPKQKLMRRVQAIVPKEPTYPKVSFVGYAKACNAGAGDVVKDSNDRKWACAALTNCAAKVTTADFKDSNYPYVRYEWNSKHHMQTPTKEDNMSDVVQYKPAFGGIMGAVFGLLLVWIM